VRFLFRQLQRGAKPAVLLSLAVLVLMLNALAASPSLHKALHADASEARHHCAVTLFAHGQVDSASADVVVAEPQTAVVFEPIVEISIFSPAIENLPAGRAPPVSASNS
jgi:hypothetical protein